MRAALKRDIEHVMNRSPRPMITIQYLPVNQAYAVMWNDQVLAIKNTEYEALEWCKSRGLRPGPFVNLAVRGG